MFKPRLISANPPPAPAGVGTSTGSNVPAQPLAPAGGIGPLVPLDRAHRRRLHRESGKSILRQRQSLNWKAATTTGQAIRHKVLSAVQLRSPSDKMADFVDRAVNQPDAQRTTVQDPNDPSYTLVQTPINGQMVSLSLKPQAAGTLVNGFVHDVQANPGLDQAISALRADGWTIAYGNAHACDPIARSITVDASRAGDNAVALLEVLLNAPLSTTGRPPVAATVEALHQRFMLEEPDDIYGCFKRKFEPYGVIKDGLYAACMRSQLAANKTWPTQGHYDANTAPAGVTAHDATMVRVYRTMFMPLNRMLRNGGPHPKVVADLVADIEHSLARFPAYQGTVVRSIGNRTGPEEQSTIDRYTHNVGNDLVEPAFTSCSKIDSDAKAVPGGNLRFMIQSSTGRDLGSVSPHAGILFRTNTEVNVLGAFPNPKCTDVYLKQK
jgi:hypothetical protein